MQTRLIVLAFLLVSLAACTPATAIPTATPWLLTTTSAPIASPLGTTTPIPTSTDTPSPTARLAPPTPFPTEPPFPVITPDAVHVAHWQEYQTELARCVLAQVGCNYPNPEFALCEWDILGQSGQEVYVWARCFAPYTGNRKPAVIHLDTDGSVQTVETPTNGSTWNSDIERMFPEYVQEKIDAYFVSVSLHSGRAEEMGIHLQYRLTHPSEPPLIVLDTTPTP